MLSAKVEVILDGGLLIEGVIGEFDERFPDYEILKITVDWVPPTMNKVWIVTGSYKRGA